VIVTKLIRAALGAGAQAGDAVADSQAFYTLEWELRSVDKALAAAFKDLTAVMALQMAEHRHIQALAQRIEADEAVAEKALARNEDALALEPIRDNHEQKKVHNRIEEAKAEQLLKQYDARAYTPPRHGSRWERTPPGRPGFEKGRGWSRAVPASFCSALLVSA
jgi:phage shock protein A